MIDMNEFHFIRPEWLLALIPLLGLLLAVKFLHKQQSGWQGVLAGHLYQHLITTDAKGQSKPPLYLLAIAWLIAVIALAGPTWERLPQPVYQLHTGKVLVMDMSLSMRATDVKPDRLTRAKYKAIDLVNAIAEGETGLIAYAGDAFMISPLSTDAQNLTTLIPSLSPEIMPEKGSEPYEGIRAAADLLTNAGYKEGEIFWITDGVEMSQVAEINDLILDIPFRISILAVGTEDGAPIKLVDGELMKDGRGAIVVPKLNSQNLKLLSSKGHGRYAPMQADDSDIQYLTNQDLISRDTEQQEQEKENFGDEWKEMGPYLLLLLLPLAAYGFRRGLISAFLFVLLTPVSTPPVQADWFDDLWQRPDQQGQNAFNKEDYKAAAESFKDPQWQGSSHYRDGNFEAAAQAFSQLEGTDALYNLGNSLAQLGKLEEAIAAYDKLLQQQPDHADAKFNKELLEQQQQQQQQEQQDQNQDQQQGENSDEQQDQEQNQQNENSQDSQGEGSQEQEQQQDEQQSESEEQEGEQQENEEQEQSEQEGEEQQQEQQSEGEEQTEAQQAELTEEQKEQMQKMENWLKKVPDDPAYLLKRKMQLENQQRRRTRLPSQTQRNW